MFFFQIQQKPLHICAIGKTGQASICADNAVTGLNDHDRIDMVGLADGTKGLGSADGFGNLFISACFAVRNLPQRLPDAALEGRADRGERQIESPSLPCEIFRKLPFGLGQKRCFFGEIKGQIGRFRADQACDGRIFLKEPEPADGGVDRKGISMHGEASDLIRYR